MKAILVVEADIKRGVKIVQTISLTSPYSALLVSHTSAVWEVMKSFIPDLMIVEDRLPNKNGSHLYDQFQLVKELQHIPFVLVDTEVSERELENCRLLGLKISFTRSDLLATVERLLA